jgi:hypothetical protein
MTAARQHEWDWNDEIKAKKNAKQQLGDIRKV